jgi:hypothetical protein
MKVSIASPEYGYILTHINLISGVKSPANRHHHEVGWHRSDYI